MAIVIHSVALLAAVLTLVYLGFLVQGAYRRQARMAQLHQDEREMLRARLDLIASPIAKVANDKSQAAWSGFRKFRIEGKVLEAEHCCSFYLAPHDGRGSMSARPRGDPGVRDRGGRSGKTDDAEKFHGAPLRTHRGRQWT